MNQSTVARMGPPMRIASSDALPEIHQPQFERHPIEAILLLNDKRRVQAEGKGNEEEEDRNGGEIQESGADCSEIPTPARLYQACRRTRSTTGPRRWALPTTTQSFQIEPSRGCRRCLF